MYRSFYDSCRSNIVTDNIFDFSLLLAIVAVSVEVQDFILEWKMSPQLMKI